MANSLGTLTLDLIAKIGGFTGPLDKASASVKKNSNEINKNLASVKVSTIAAGVALGDFAGNLIGSIPGALKSFVTGSAEAAKEITKLSGLAGVSTTEFQKYAAAAATVGIEQDKLSDILKDTNDKVGDFLSTGAGGMKDFFTNIAPLVGVTADNFKKLNGADALKLYVTSLEKANVSQKEMTFYMEAIANDSTALVPLLRNNGKAFDELGAAAESAGVVLDTQTIAAAAQFSTELTKVEQYLGSAKVALAAEFMPVLAQFAKDLTDSTEKAGGLGKAVHGAAGDIVAAGATVANIGDVIARTFNVTANYLVGMFATAAGHIQNLTAQVNAGLSLITIGDAAAEFKKDSESLANDARINFGVASQAAQAIVDDFNTPLAGNRLKEYVAQAQEAATQLKAIDNSTKGTGSGVDPAAIKAREDAAKKAASAAVAAAKKVDDAFKSTETDYKRQIELINTTTDATKNATEVQKLAFEIQSGKLVGINALQQERLNALAAELDALEKVKKATEDNAKAATFASNLAAENQTVRGGFASELAGAGSGDKLRERLKADLAIQQEYNEKAADLQKQLNAGDIQKDLYDTQTALLEDALRERLALQHDYYEQLDAAQNNWIDGVTSAFENYRDTATDYQQQAADATSSILGDTTSGLSDSLEGLATKTMTLGEAVLNLGSTLTSSVLRAITDIAAQWLATQALQLAGISAITTATVASEATKTAAKVTADATMTASSLTATTTTTGAQVAAAGTTLSAWLPAALVASIGSFGAAAVVGGAALIAAFALIKGFETGGYTGDGPSNAPAGVVHKGEFVFTKAQTAAIGVDRLKAFASGYEDGGLVTGIPMSTGERVTNPAAAGKLDRALADSRNDRGLTVNLVEDASKAGRQERRTGQNGDEQLDIFVADLLGDGKTADAFRRKYGLQTVGT